MPGVSFERVSSRAVWEDQVGYCRALRAGDLVFVTGTAPVDESGAGVHAVGDAYAQARRCLELIERAIAGFGIDRTRIVRTRVAEGDADLYAQRAAWRSRGLVKAAGTFDA